ncbi:hypothetical protein N7468_009450 [Penicillium chermesinum]|uniref:CsbD-like domain-containing protein n=1 Tax=Penicillium chermesinum TaxID=63820 RepID=A0A9W9NHT7_9EURO|nr:uncharacterized protein N7468_009450 [Penicillium chermesinum]KAJ5220246.1 hypothetical protein N7468_009450 [Penicillium chermesinum]KAJ6157690.1 hypothetical protein N7470_005282 [Penicillium chermesinum]
MSDGNSSTLGSYVNAATGAAQRAVGAITGDSSTQAKGDLAQEQAKSQNEASHTTAKLGPVTADPNTGAVARDDPKRDTGSWDQTVGSVKEAAGNLTGIESLRRAGVEQNQAGKEQEAKGQLKDLGEGLQDRAEGTLGGIAAAVAGDREQEEKYRDIHDEGKTRQRGAEADINKKQGL